MVRISKSGIWFSFHIFPFSEPTFFLLYARRRVKTESGKWTVPKENSCCFSSEYRLLLLLGGLQMEGDALGGTGQLMIRWCWWLCPWYGSVGTWASSTRSVCWSLQLVWKYCSIGSCPENWTVLLKHYEIIKRKWLWQRPRKLHCPQVAPALLHRTLLDV